MSDDGRLFGLGRGGVVGDRQLIAVQTIDLGRLTHHPVPLTPASLIAISGTGPGRDSNGSGKTTFLASLSLLLGDPEWHISGSGGQDALGLLFDPELSGDAAGRYDPATVGFVCGVFARSTVDGDYDELSVWVRISADDSPRVAARWTHGVHLAGDRDQAAAIWNSIGREHQIGPQAMVEQLYGGSGRCLAYVTSRGTRDTDSSLLQLQARLNPTRIGSELIVLLGMDHLIEGERRLRSSLADAAEKLQARISEREHHERDWSLRLSDIEARDSARASIAEGHALWRRRTARRLLDAIANEQRIRTDADELAKRRETSHSLLTDARERLELLSDSEGLEAAAEAARREWTKADEALQGANSGLAEINASLRQIASTISARTTEALAAPPGLASDAAESAVDDAEAKRRLAIEAEGAAKREREQARDRLVEIAEHGDVDPATLDALRTAGVPTRVLLDLIEVDQSERNQWEPLLAPWRGALLIGPEHLQRALAVSPPGTVLVVEDDAVLSAPSGVVAPTGAHRFLLTLLDRSAPPFTDEVAGVVVGGNFEHELCGRDAAIQRARSALDIAEALHEQAASVRERADGDHELATKVRSAVRAREEVVTARERERALQTDLAPVIESIDTAKAAVGIAHDALVNAEAGARSHAQNRSFIVDEINQLEERDDGLARELEALDAEMKANDIGGWRSAWGGSDDSAVDELTGDERVESTFRRRAAECLTEALVRIGVDIRTGQGAPTAAIEEVIRTRHGLDDETAVGPEHRRFDIVVRPLVDWLDDLAVDDATFREEIEAERARWNESINAASSERDEQQGNLDRHRDMVSRQLEVAFEAVSDRYTELDLAADGYGARLAVRNTPPQTPTDLWTWEITPEWRRAPGGRFVPYTRQANSAMQKQHRTHLVLAALLASENPAGRVLIIDEAGNDFGREHLRQVLSAFARVASTHGVTVIAACQDKVLEEVAALGHARMLLWFERLSDSSPLCRPARVWGFDPDGGRIELTRPAVEAGRLM